MKKAIFKNFIIILLLALILSGSIFSLVISNVLSRNTRQNMLNILHILDETLDYDKDLKGQIDQLTLLYENSKARITIMDIKGIILVDSNISDYVNMENHIDREEIQQALREGKGAARRKSGTLNISMLYVSYISRQGDYILRIAMPFSGLWDYVLILFPAILMSLGVSLIISLILANRFSRTITKPLYEISEQLLKLQENNPEFSFKPYEYFELNLIADTTKRMADAVKESIKKIEFEKLIRQEFFTNASHELKTPITSIRGYIELLENGMATDENMKLEFMGRIKKEAQNMTELINDILMISRLETKEVEVIRTDVRICSLINELIASLKPLAAENNITIEMSCKPIVISANHGQMRELFNNLLTNAIKYNKPNGQVKVYVTTEGNDAIFIVEDSGVGIPEESRQRVFERFYRVDRGRSKKLGGTGLGLSIVKHIVNYYNGTIELDSKEGRGSKFTVRIPMS
ncbi:MAG: GHKL domain-containing protein [Clostridiales bacterium]|nr:GHKL domain-containing protein [Clostridiales bacterium]